MAIHVRRFGTCRRRADHWHFIRHPHIKPTVSCRPARTSLSFRRSQICHPARRTASRDIKRKVVPACCLSSPVACIRARSLTLLRRTEERPRRFERMGALPTKAMTAKYGYAVNGCRLSLCGRRLTGLRSGSVVICAMHSPCASARATPHHVE